jgi:hypothetical protein
VLPFRTLWCEWLKGCVEKSAGGGSLEAAVYLNLVQVEQQSVRGVDWTVCAAVYRTIYQAVYSALFLAECIFFRPSKLVNSAVIHWIPLPSYRRLFASLHAHYWKNRS